MTHPFLPPLSGALLGGLVETLGLPLSLDKKQMSGMCLSGEYVKDASYLSILDELAKALVDAHFVDVGLANVSDVRRALEQNGVLWDRLVGQAENTVARAVESHPYAPRAFARIITIDVAMRAAALRIAAALPPPLEEWWKAAGRGELIKELTKGKGENIADKIGTSRSRLTAWYDDANPSNANLERLAEFLHPDGADGQAPASRRATLLRLRRHYAAWRLKDVAERLLPKDFAAECLEAFVALVNWFMWLLINMKKTEATKKTFFEDNFRANLLRLVLDGRNYPITDEAIGELGRGLRRLAAAHDKNPQWVAALLCDDLLYVQRHATNILSVMLHRESALGAGATPSQIESLFSLENEDLWDPPVRGHVPMKRNGEPAHRDMRVALVSAEADELLLHGDLDGSLAARTRAVEIDPHDSMAHFLLGELLGEMGRLADAIAACQRAIDLDPRFEIIEAREGLAAWLNAAGRHPEAERVLRTTLAAIGDENAEVELLFQLGCALLEQQKNPEADAVLRRAAEMNPEDSFVLAAAAEAAGRVADPLRSNDLKKRAHHLGLPTKPTKLRRR